MGSNCTNATELWAGVQKGDKKALSDLYGMYADPLYEFGKSYSPDNCLVEDSIHDLFLELYIRRNSLPDARNIKNYLFTIPKRKIVELRKKRPLVISLKDDHSGRIYRNQELSTETQLIHKEENEELGVLLSNALKKLTLKQRKGVSMRYYENRSYAEIALVLGISIETARTSIYRSLKSIKENFS